MKEPSSSDAGCRCNKAIATREVHSPEAILEFWFNHCRPAQWFRRDPRIDETIRRRFRPSVDAALASHLDHWKASAPSALALVLLLDQFPRNLWRGEAKAFAGDPKALAISFHAEQQGWIAQEPIRPRRQFWLMPRLHCEDLEVLNASLNLFERWTDQATLAIARRRRNEMAEHGRFPHRDRALGRTTTH